MPRVVTVVEIDVTVCALTYGVAPCTAAIPTTGTRKCFNTLRTCQDRVHFAEQTMTLRFMRPSGEVDSFDGIPILGNVSVTPQVLDPGVSIGQRESVSVTFEDCEHSDAGFDKYLADRGYETYKRGTFWGRFRARIPSLQGCALRVKRGMVGQPIEEMETWHYLVESTQGPAAGSFSVTAKDTLKLADGDRAQAPRISRGTLLAGIDDNDGSATLSPTGIGDLEYPSNGTLALSGNEIVTFTRSGDALTLTGRGLAGTEATSHAIDARVQVVLTFTAQTPAAILQHLLVNYTDVDSTWIDLPAWESEVAAFTSRLYTALIAEPTDVKKLINEIVQQVGLVLWSDTRALQLRLVALRQVAADADVYDTDRIMVGTFASKEQLGKRVSQSWTFYGLRNPLASAEDDSNFQGVAVDLDETGADLEYGAPAIRKTYSRWINMFNRQAAHRVNELLLSRYRDPPRRLNFDVFASDTPPQAGRGIFLKHWDIQDDTGAEQQIPAQVVSVETTDDRTRVQVEELISAGAGSGGSGGGSGGGIPPDTDDLVVYIDVDGFNLNLRTIYDSIYAAPDSTDVVRFIIGGGVNIGTRAGGSRWALISGAWPEGPEIRLENNGAIMGRGGDGGIGRGTGRGASGAEKTGKPGEHGLRTTVPMVVINRGIIAGGGGGGGGNNFRGSGGGGGGGGAGYEGSLPGPNNNGSPEATGGYLTTPGTKGATGGIRGGDGGALGTAGQDAYVGYPGGPPGAAVHGTDLITWDTYGTVYGATLNSGDPLP
jgi:tail fiber adhesin Gp38